MSLCRLSAFTAKPLQVSAGLSARPSGKDISHGHRGDVCAIMEGRPDLNVACESTCLCTGAWFKTLKVCTSFYKFTVYENKNQGFESDSKQALFQYSQSHLHIFELSAQFKESSTAAMYSLLYCSSSQAPHKIHTSQTSTTGCLSLGLWALHHVCVCVCV